MAPRTPAASLTDIVEAIELILGDMDGLSLESLTADRRQLWVIERGIEIVSEASRRLPDDMKARHTSTPWRKIAGIGNVLRHEYAELSPGLLWLVIRDHLPSLLEVCRIELTRCETSENLD
jgi:uncharacterized protein with HEPN domain